MIAFAANSSLLRFKQVTSGQTLTTKAKRAESLTHSQDGSQDGEEDLHHDEDNNNHRCRRRRRKNKNNRQCKSSRKRAKQQHASRCQLSQASRSFDDQFKQFDRGSEKYKECLEPTIAELFDYVNNEHCKATKKNDRAKLNATALELVTQEQSATGTVQWQVDSLWKSGTYGHTPKDKPHDTIRIFV